MKNFRWKSLGGKKRKLGGPKGVTHGREEKEISGGKKKKQKVIL